MKAYGSIVQGSARRIALLACAALVAFAVALIGGTGQAYASDLTLGTQASVVNKKVVYHPKSTFTKKEKQGFKAWEYPYSDSELRMWANSDYIDLSWGTKVKNLKSSNKKVATVKLEQSGGVIRVAFKKAGKATVTYTIGSKKYKIRYTVKKWSNPVKSFKIGKKQYKGVIGRSKGYRDIPANFYRTDLPIAGKVSIKAAKGWKLQKILVEPPYNGKKIANGTVLKKSQNIAGVYAYFKNKYSGVVERINIIFFWQW